MQADPLRPSAGSAVFERQAPESRSDAGKLSGDAATTAGPDAAKLDHATQALSSRVQELERELDAFTCSVSHDLRAPLRAIEGFARILRDDHAKHIDAEGQRCLEVVLSNTRQAIRMMDALLAFSRLAQVPIQRSAIDMTAMVGSIIDEFRKNYPEGRMRIEARPLPVAFGDATLIRQATAHLISNAFKFTQQQVRPYLEIGGWEEGEHVYYVKDNGIGFDMRYASKLFVLFQRLHRSEQFDGLGVGLAIAKRIVQRHGGRMWVEAKVNEGACFWFSLPRGPATEGAKP